MRFCLVLVLLCNVSVTTGGLVFCIFWGFEGFFLLVVMLFSVWVLFIFSVCFCIVCVGVSVCCSLFSCVLWCGVFWFSRSGGRLL